MMRRSYEITPRDGRSGGGWNLTLFEDEQPAGGGAFPLPQEEASVGITWWNSMTEEPRRHWLEIAASAAPAAARHAFRLVEAYREAQAEADAWMNADA